ncbi:hypothetical protein P5V15_005791 [Pogonomyrmex californicus]
MFVFNFKLSNFFNRNSSQPYSSCEKETAALKGGLFWRKISCRHENSEEEEEKEEEQETADEEREEEVGEEQVEEETKEEEEREQARSASENEVRNFNHLLLIGENSCRFRNFEILEREAIFRLCPLPEGVELYNWLENAFAEIYAYALHTSKPHDYVEFSFDSEDLTHGPVGLSFRSVCDLIHEDI